MIRYSLLTLVLVGIMAYGWKNWYRALCLLLPMVAIMQRQDMPRAMFGVQGLNPFNIGLASILIAWMWERWSNPSEPEGKSARGPGLLIGLFVVVIFVGFLRLFVEPAGLLTRYSSVGLVSAFLVNALEWMIPGLLLFSGCRSKEDQQWAVWSVTSLYLILAVQTIRAIPLSYLLDGQALSERAGRVLARYVGYHRVELAGVFAGASWAMLAARPLFRTPLVRVGLLSMSAITLFALALTAGRMGYVTWCGIGLLVGVLRWPRVLVLAPIAILLLLWYAPGVQERLLQGFVFGSTEAALERGAQTDFSAVTSGRSKVWPYVLASISERPVFGYGRDALNRNGLRETILLETREDVGHPHNGYFQFALDNGLVGLAICLLLYVTLVWKSAILFRSDDAEAATAGGMAFASLAAYLFAAAGAQTFYPTELSVGLWASVGLLKRVSRREARSEAATEVIRPIKVDGGRNAFRLRWRLTRLGLASKTQTELSDVAKKRRFASRGRASAAPAAGNRLSSRS